MLAFGNEVPAVVIGLVAGAVVHKDLVQSLERQEAGVGVGRGAVGVRPILRDEGVEDAGLDHLALDLVAILNEGHGKRAGALQGVSGQLIEDLVVLGLLPLELHVVAGVDGLQIFNEQRQGALAAAGVADAVEHLAVGLFNGLLRQLFKGHAFGFLDDLLGRSQIFGLCSGRFLCGSLGRLGGFSGFGRLGIFCGSGRVSRGRRRSGSAGSHGQNHHSSQQKRKHLLHSDIPPDKI